MLKTVIEKEIRDLIGSTKFAITFGACAFLIIAAFWGGAARYGLHQSHYEASRTQNLRQLEGMTDWTAVGSTNIFLPPQPLSTLVSGVSNDIGRTTLVTGRGETSAMDSRFNEDPIYAVFRFLDIEFLFQVILSLFAILLGYDAISGEKERGTLRLTFANAVPRHTYLLGKMTGSFIVLGVSLLSAVAIGSLLLPLMGVPLAGEDWGRLALIVLTGLLYFGVFLTLSVFVSAMTQRSSSSFLWLLVIWIVSVLVIPRVSVLMAGRAVEVPSVDEMASQKARLSSQLRDEFIDGLGHFSTEGRDITGDPTRFLMTFMDSLTDVRETKMQEFAGRLNEDRFNRQREQQKLAFGLARISPAASLSLAISRLSRTSTELKNRFFEESMTYKESFGQFMKEKTGSNAGGSMRIITVGGPSENAEEPKAIDPSELPVFRFAGASLTEAVNESAVDMGILVFFNLLFFAGAFAAFVRYDVR
ncbi:MAG: hypothetical protein DRP45_03110 [Candidatus Zixiibacteriota bacterium]|nr:MAG: hypothetical protein DRP45_03110 [candidate division Zixibacteria bacterium]